MNCPKCKREQMRSETHGGVEFERCPVCKGMFFDKGRLEQALTQREGGGDTFAFSAVSDAMDEVVAHCPRCNVAMDVVEGADLRLDECSHCGAVFLDQGELATLNLHRS